jgi:methylthioxylose transferase
MAIDLRNVSRDDELVDTSPSRAVSFGHTWLAVAIWSALAVGVHVWGRVINQSHATKVLAPPLFGRFDLRLTAAILVPALFAALVVRYAPPLAQSLEWRRLLLTTIVVAAGWAVSLAAVDGIRALSAPLENPNDYLSTVQDVGSPAAFVDRYTRELPTYSVHVQGHPPGMVLVLWAMGQMGLGGAWPATALIITVGASSAAAALIAVRAVAGEQCARRAAPFLALAPAAVWMATSADALFMGVSAWGIALLAVAAARRSDRLSFIGGLAIGGGLMLSYGVVSLGVVAAAVVLMQRRFRPLVLGGAGILAVLGVFALGGFSWFDGLTATLERYKLGVAGQRPYGFFLVANLAAFSLAIGPATAVSFGRLKDARIWAVAGAALVALALADLSGFSKGEAERIWLIFVPWVVLSCSAFDFRRARGMLGLQAAVALAVQTGVRTPW